MENIISVKYTILVSSSQAGAGQGGFGGSSSRLALLSLLQQSLLPLFPTLLYALEPRCDFNGRQRSNIL